MQGPIRKVVQAVLYETLAVFFITPAIALIYDEDVAYSTGLAVTISLVALSWNMLYNAGFEAWEARQVDSTRTLTRRVMHSAGYEGSLTIMLLPLIAWWLDISLLGALGANLGLFVFFLLYAFAFQWGFDKVFGVPDSTRNTTSCSA